MQIPGFGEIGSTGMVGALGLSMSPVGILWKIALIALMLSITMSLLRFVPRAEV